MADPYAGWLDEFYGAAEIDPVTGEPTTSTPANPINWGTPGAGWGNAGDWGTFLTQLSGGNYSDILKSLLGGTGLGGPLGSFLGSAGIGLLLNRLNNNTPAPVGYQGGVPKFTYERAQTPMAQQRPEGYRPGQGGISYFAPGKFKPAGYTPKTAEEFLVAPPPPAPTPTPTPETTETISAASGGEMPGGIAMLAQGRYLKGNGDGVSDSIPAQFVGSGRRAALADGEFVIPARVVSELGNGSSDAGARKLYAFMDRVESKAKKAKRGKPSGADKELNRLA